jgi:Rrf2 family iron-sulfur cluster assembly transcriptional regulator
MRTISKKARYALHGLAFVAEYGRSEPVPFNRILGYLRAYSQRLSLSPSYIAKVFQEISRAGFTTAVSGPRGGYQLARSPGSIRVIDVWRRSMVRS